MLLQPEKEHYEIPCPDKYMITDIIHSQNIVKSETENQYASIKKTIYDHLKFKQVDTVTILPYSLYFEKKNLKTDELEYNDKRIKETLHTYGKYRLVNFRSRLAIEQIKKMVFVMKPDLLKFKNNIHEVLSWIDQSLIEELLVSKQGVYKRKAMIVLYNFLNQNKEQK